MLAAIRGAGYNVTECIIANNAESDADIENALALSKYDAILIGSIAHETDWHARISALAQKVSPGIKIITPPNRDGIVSTIRSVLPYKPQEYVEESKDADNIVQITQRTHSLIRSSYQPYIMSYITILQ